MEEGDDRGPGEKVGICQVGPSTDGEGSTGVLGLDRVSNIPKLPILKEQKVLPSRYLL